MVAKNIFGLVVRLVGLAIAVYGLYVLVNGLTSLAGSILWAGIARVWEEQTYFQLSLGFGAALAVWGVLTLRWADRIVRYTYRPQPGLRCNACGYDLRATPGRCPECGIVAEKA